MVTLKKINAVPVDKKKVVRLQGVKEDGSEVYLGRHEGFVALVIQEEHEVEDK